MLNLFKILVGIILNILYRIEFVGMENVPQKGNAILCANHIGQLDMFFIGYRLKRLIRYMAKEELFKPPFMSAFMVWVGAFPVKRGKGDVGAIRTALKLLHEGEIVGIFAEGTRTINKDKSKIKINPGVAMLAIKTGTPILPVAIKGNYKLFSKVKVVFGKTYYIDTEEGKKYTSEELTDISKSVMQRVYSLLEEK